MIYVNRHPRFLWWATAVLLLAASLRLVGLQDVPPGLSQDEVLNADIVTFIQQGQHAFFFREGYGHEPLYHYWSVPFQPLFGDNVLSIRLPAVYLGMLLIALTMRWGKREFDDVTAVVAGLGLAVSWWPVIFSRIGIRAILEPLLLLGMAWFWPRRERANPYWAGLFLGVSVYSYTAARVVFLIPALFFIYLLITFKYEAADNGVKEWRRLREPLIVLAVALLLYGPLWLTLRADPTLQQRLDQLDGPLQALQQGDVGPVWETTVATLGVFSVTGDPRWTYTLPDRPLFDPITAVFFYGGLLIVLARWRRPVYGLLLIWLGVTLLPSALAPQAPSIIRMIGSLPVVYILVGVAVGWLGQRLPRRQGVIVGYGGLLVALLLLNLGGTVRDGFIRWPQALETHLKYQTVWLDISRDWPDGVATLIVADSFFEPIDADSLRRNKGVATTGRWVQAGNGHAGGMVFPHEAVEPTVLYVPEFAPLSPQLLTAAGIAPEPLYRSRRSPSFAVYEVPITPPLAWRETAVSFGEWVTLLGYVVEKRPLQVITYWQVEEALPWDLATFVHVVDEDGQVVAQHDGLDVAPTTLQVGDRFLQLHPLHLPNEMARYRLQVGLYTRTNGERLTTMGERLTITDELADYFILCQQMGFTVDQDVLTGCE